MRKRWRRRSRRWWWWQTELRKWRWQRKKEGHFEENGRRIIKKEDGQEKNRRKNKEDREEVDKKGTDRCIAQASQPSALCWLVSVATVMGHRQHRESCRRVSETSAATWAQNRAVCCSRSSPSCLSVWLPAYVSPTKSPGKLTRRLTAIPYLSALPHLTSRHANSIVRPAMFNNLKFYTVFFRVPWRWSRYVFRKHLYPPI
jgi:hypothetical protein